MERITYFDEPTQVVYWDFPSDEEVYSGQYIGGIAYCGEIICGECGSIIDIEELYEIVPEDIEAIKILSWIDLHETIVGDYNPLEED